LVTARGGACQPRLRDIGLVVLVPFAVGSVWCWIQSGGNVMAEPGCANCKLRARHDQNPKSFLGRLWRWHAGWCPGFKSYLFSLPEGERRALAEKYGLAKYR
jgi:hypothetical protein